MLCYTFSSQNADFAFDEPTVHTMLPPYIYVVQSVQERVLLLTRASSECTRDLLKLKVRTFILDLVGLATT